jgi:hypothetical protein
MNDRATRKLVLKLAAISQADRDWLLGRLPQRARQELEALLATVPGWADGRRAWLPRLLPLCQEQGAGQGSCSEAEPLDNPAQALGAEWMSVLFRSGTPSGSAKPVLADDLPPALKASVEELLGIPGEPAREDFATVLDSALSAGQAG